MTDTLTCTVCSAPLTGKQLRFCCRKHAMDWHNSQGSWKERKDRHQRNARWRARYKADPEYWRNRQKQWRADHPEQTKLIYERQRAKHPLSPWRRMVKQASTRAKTKGLPFDLTFEWAKARWTGFCELTKIPFIIAGADRGSAIFFPSLDRIEPAKGYVQTNCRFILFGLNTFKSNGTDEAMYLVAEALLANKPVQKAAPPML
jgi:hypothetical protein